MQVHQTAATTVRPQKALTLYQNVAAVDAVRAVTALGRRPSLRSELTEAKKSVLITSPAV